MVRVQYHVWYKFGSDTMSGAASGTASEFGYRYQVWLPVLDAYRVAGCDTGLRLVHVYLGPVPDVDLSTFIWVQCSILRYRTWTGPHIFASSMASGTTGQGKGTDTRFGYQYWNRPKDPNAVPDVE